ncbi:MAG: flagellar hook-length control protein FliK [Lachnospiraceae bacterium]|nr:flagellar hook-length control protein FliK [Lachnospiraceae bacterium]
MNLSSVINQINQHYSQARTGEVMPSQLEQGLKNGMDVLMGKLPGQAVTGEVMYVNGSDILLSLGKNQLLQASLEGNMTATEGQLLTFQIKNSAGSKVVLSPLFENIGQNPNITRALEAAGIPETESSAAMVKAMMEEGMPIDKQSLYQMNRIVNANPQADIQTLVQMHRLQIPITEETIFQFQAYKNYEHQISNSLTDIADAFSQTFQQLTGSSSPAEGLQFYGQVLDLLTGETMEAAQNAQPEGEQAAVLGNGGDAAGGLITGREGLLAGEGGILSGAELEDLVSQMKQAGMPEELTQAVADNKLSGQAFLKEVSQFLQKEGLPFPEQALELLDGKEFKNILKNEMNRQWLLLPEEVGQEQSVDKLYERLNNQMNRLSQVVSQAAGPESALAQTVTNVNHNIDFMNQLNQMFTYVQIPLKLQGQEASGELFVYTNKKSLAKADGTVSALLHLDMEHLGSVDVHVSLTGQKVATKFYLADDSALDLIADNIDLLNKRLENRGYSMTAEFVQREEQTNVMEEMLKQDKNISVLSGYSFDARA